MPETICEFCTRPVLPHEQAAARIRAWQVLDTKRLIGREEQPGRLAHAGCAESAARYPNQRSLV